jgi:hypothetical protein
MDSDQILEFWISINITILAFDFIPSRLNYSERKNSQIPAH